MGRLCRDPGCRGVRGRMRGMLRVGAIVARSGDGYGGGVAGIAPRDVGRVLRLDESAMVPDEGVVLAVLPDFIGPAGATVGGDELHDVWLAWVADGVLAVPFVLKGEAVRFRVRGKDALAFGVLVTADAEDGCPRGGGSECAVFIPGNEYGNDDGNGFHSALLGLLPVRLQRGLAAVVGVRCFPLTRSIIQRP